MKLSKKIKILAAIALGGTVVLVTVGNGCSKRSAFDTGFTGSSVAGNAASSAPTEEVIDPNVKMVSVSYAKQMLDQVTSCAGVKKASDNTIRVYQQKSGAVSLYGDAGSVTAPMMMATTNIVAEVCNDLIQQEKTMAPHIFVNWSLNSQAMSKTLPTNADISDAVSRLALSCWQKAPSNEELTNMLDLAVTDAPTREQSALMVCTAVLSSLKTLLN
jgi:hypothetical protein